MIRKFLSKYILEVIPSIVATVAGAYIVTHYISSKPEADKPKAAVASPVNPAKDAAKNESPSASKQAVEKPAADKTEKNDKSDKADTASAPAEPRRHQPMPREKAAAKVAPVAAPPAEAKEAVAKADDPRDANEIARAAIERLRGAEPRRVEPPRVAEPAQESSRQEPARQERAKSNTAVYAPPVPQQPPLQQPPVQSLPQAVTVTPVPSETTVGTAPAPFPVPVSPPPMARADDPSRPTPPAEIPSRPLDLRAKDRTSVAEDVVSTAKSVFHAVIPGIN